MIRSFFAHPYAHQLANLTLLLILGKAAMHVAVAPYVIALVLGSAILWEVVFQRIFTCRARIMPLSATLSGFGILFMIAADAWWVYVAVAGIGIAQKYLTRIAGAHIFNPSNVAVCAALVLFPSHVMTITGQWGVQYTVLWLIAILGAAILVRVRRTIIPIVFAVAYIGGMYLVTYSATMTLRETVEMIVTGGFLIFALFMLTDPRTTPSHLLAQVAFACIAAGASIALYIFADMRGTQMFFGLLIASLTVPLLRSMYGEVSRHQAVRYAPVAAVAMIGVFFIASTVQPVTFVMPGINH